MLIDLTEGGRKGGFYQFHELIELGGLLSIKHFCKINYFVTSQRNMKSKETHISKIFNAQEDSKSSPYLGGKNGTRD